MERLRLTAPNGSEWIASETHPNPYGRPTPPDRAWWVWIVTGPKPQHLSGVLGFYAPSLEAARAKLEG